jgi:hypothetical protein
MRHGPRVTFARCASEAGLTGCGGAASSAAAASAARALPVCRAPFRLPSARAIPWLRSLRREASSVWAPSGA